jgi:putative ABC transport system permease protein
VDELFTNGPQRVQTTSEAEFQRQFVSMMGGVPVFLGSIGGAIVFAILLAALNTMLMSARQRTREFGILRALGFGDWTVFGLLVLESVLVCGLGGALGVGIMVAITPSLAASMSTMFPVFLLTRETIAMGLGLSFGVGLVAGMVPALEASRLDPVEALRMEV